MDHVPPPPPGRRHRRRDVCGRAESGRDQRRRRLRLAGCAAGAPDRPGAGRRTPAAGRRSRRVRTPVLSTARGIRAGAPSGWMPDAPASTRWSNSSSIGWITDALPRAHRHSREPRGARGLPRRRAAARATTRRWCSATWSATAAIPTPSSNGPGARTDRDRARQPRQGGVRARAGRGVQRRGQERREVDARGAETRPSRLAVRAAGRADRSSTRSSRSAMGRRSTRTPTSSTRLDAIRALKVSNRQLCLFGHTHYPVTFELSVDGFDSVGSAAAPTMQVQMRTAAST